jgi:hypothetical protein
MNFTARSRWRVVGTSFRIAVMLALATAIEASAVLSAKAAADPGSHHRA